MKTHTFTFLLLFLPQLGDVWASDKHDHERHKAKDEHTHNVGTYVSHIENTLAQQVGIETSSASPQTFHQTITAYGSLTFGPEQLSHVRARFAGLITSVQATIGDRVKAGDLLAEVESNESLKTYKMRAPISGLIVQRHANTGEVTLDQILFSIANFDSLWAEFRIYPTQQSSVNKGQKVHIIENSRTIEGIIQHVIPALDKPYQIARVELDNTKKELSPGFLIEGRIEIDTFDVMLAVDKDAVQNLGGRRGVFIKHGNEYKFAPLVLGRSDHQGIEVLGGLQNGTEYVSKNSYLIRADIEKSEAEHDH